jgi:hypothetical protein
MTRDTTLKTNASTLENNQTQDHHPAQNHDSQHVYPKAPTPGLFLKNPFSPLGSRTAAWKAAVSFCLVKSINLYFFFYKTLF